MSSRQADISVRSAHCYNIVNYTLLSIVELHLNTKYNVVVIQASSLTNTILVIIMYHEQFNYSSPTAGGIKQM